MWYLWNMNYSISEEQLFSMLDAFFDTMYHEVKYQKEGDYIWVYNGDKIKKTFRRVQGGYTKPNVIMSYSPFGNRLEINPEVYQNLISWVPIFKQKKIVIHFFTEWFKDKFNVDISDTYFADKSIMDDIG